MALKFFPILIRLLKPTAKNVTVFSRCKHLIDKSRVPVLREDEIEEEFVRGSGPGGQAVNKTANCVVLQHKPTGISIKCHQTRSLEQNRVIARQLLVMKLDSLVNGEMSVEAQERRIFEKKSQNFSRKSKKIMEMKKAWKEREGLE